MAEEAEEMQKAQALVNQLQVMKDDAQQIAQKINELDQERHEHGLVAETLEKLDSDRKCFRCTLLSTPALHQTSIGTLRSVCWMHAHPCWHMCGVHVFAWENVCACVLIHASSRIFSGVAG